MITIKRVLETKDGIVSVITCGEFQGFGLELPWKDNQNYISCYPAGHYRIFIRDEKKIELIDVPGRTVCQIHSAATVEDLKGCTGVGFGIQTLNGVTTLLYGRDAFKKLLEELRKTKDYTLSVERTY